MRSRAAPFTALIIGIICGANAAFSASAPLMGPPPVSAIKPSGIVWKEGENYEVLTPAARAAPSGKVEVLEFFQYKCPHCYTMEPHLVLWKSMYGNLATVTRVPVTYKPLYRSLARLYYTLEALGRIDMPNRDDLHHEVFDQVHRLWKPVASENEEEDFKLQLDFAVASGIDAGEFTKAYRSAAVEAKVKRAEELGKTYRITATPMFVVGGKYKTDIPEAGDEYRLMYLLTDLSLMAR